MRCRSARTKLCKKLVDPRLVDEARQTSEEPEARDDGGSLPVGHARSLFEGDEVGDLDEIVQLERVPVDVEQVEVTVDASLARGPRDRDESYSVSHLLGFDSEVRCRGLDWDSFLLLAEVRH